MKVTFTVTNDLNYDQRMIRICNSLVNYGYNVKIIGVKSNSSSTLEKKKYLQKRLPVFFKNGIAFYLEYNLRLFIYLLFQKTDLFCCIDLDTILPVFFTSVLKRKIRIYDAHEYFSQQKEIVTRPKIYFVWHFIERIFVPKFLNGYTVSDGIAKDFLKNYHVKYEVIRNVPLLKPLSKINFKEKIILYTGSVNEGRGFEYLIPAMKNVNAVLLICGDGNFLKNAKSLVEKNNLQNKIIFKGKFLPYALEQIIQQAYIGINLVEPLGKNQLLSLANKFFDYMQHTIPQVTMDFPEYKKINDEFETAILINNLSVRTVSMSINLLLEDEELYFRLQQNCMKAREVFNWQNEQEKLIRFYSRFNATNK
ncbi:MAG: glycosyltransferase [Bacteroidota bacterium]|nr:glycosyltransferase [Bacteroidota bacterium]